ncbi:MAG TPA: c-type cytochrome biogenesis protein CcsB [Actinomycetes bacterium]|nr:c-type cytochrome biogenesis protein CcsB [Actinomycetes bacterium]
MFVLALALLAFAADLAVGSGRRRAAMAERHRRALKVAVQAGSAGTEERRTSVDVIDRPPEDPSPDPVDTVDDRWARVGVSLSTLAFLLMAAAVITRGISAGRPPWGNMYEFSLAGATAAMGVWLLLVRRRPEIRELGLVVVLAALLILGVAVVVLYTEAAQLVPALKSYWLWIHVTAAIIASGIFTVGSVASLLYLFAERYERRVATGATNERMGTLDSFGARLPSSKMLDRTAYQTIAFAFPLWFFAIVAGAIWAEGAWGRYWGWDPKETWAFITLVIYAAYLHARATAGWRGRPAAIIALVGFGAFLFSYIGVNIFFFGLHSYGGV